MRSGTVVARKCLISSLTAFVLPQTPHGIHCLDLPEEFRDSRIKKTLPTNKIVDNKIVDNNTVDNNTVMCYIVAIHQIEVLHEIIYRPLG